MTCAECPICMESIGTVNCCTTECGHTFHSSCLFKNFNNSDSCPLCRKELLEDLEEDSDDEYSDDEEDDSASDSDDEDGIRIHETEEPSDNKDANKITINMVFEAMKKKGYNEKDFMTLIIIESANERSKLFKKDTIDRSNDMLDYLYKILDNEIHVDYRDSRTYASVVNGVPKTNPRGRGPISII